MAGRGGMQRRVVWCAGGTCTSCWRNDSAADQPNDAVSALVESACRREHLMLGFPWSEHLALELRDCLRAVSRGLGPPAVVPWLLQNMRHWVIGETNERLGSHRSESPCSFHHESLPSF